MLLIDIDGITHIFNYDGPNNPEDYVHRMDAQEEQEKKEKLIQFLMQVTKKILCQLKLINKK